MVAAAVLYYRPVEYEISGVHGGINIDGSAERRGNDK